VRTKCAGKTSVGLWGQSRDPRELPGVTGPGHGVAGVLHGLINEVMLLHILTHPSSEPFVLGMLGMHIDVAISDS
jgi:hypothetical protein